MEALAVVVGKTGKAFGFANLGEDLAFQLARVAGIKAEDPSKDLCLVFPPGVIGYGVSQKILNLTTKES